MELIGSAGSRAETGIPAAWAAAISAALLAAWATDDMVELGRDRDFAAGGPPPLLLRLAGDSFSVHRSRSMPLLSRPLPLEVCSRFRRWRS